MYCKNCGKELTDETKFCAYCGTPVEQETTMADEKEVQPAEQDSKKETVSRTDENQSEEEMDQVIQNESVLKTVNTSVAKIQPNASTENAIEFGKNKWLIIAGFAFAVLALFELGLGIWSLTLAFKGYGINNWLERYGPDILSLIGYALLSIACFKFSPKVLLTGLMVLGFANRLFDSIHNITDSWKFYEYSFGLGKTILYMIPASLLIIINICGIICLCLYCFSWLNKNSFSNSDATYKEPFVPIKSTSITSKAKDYFFVSLNRFFSGSLGSQIKNRIDLKNLTAKKKAGLVICLSIVIIGLVFFVKGISGTGNSEYKYSVSANSENNDAGKYSQVLSDKQAVSALYATSAFKGNMGYETAVEYGTMDDVSIGEVLDYMFTDPKVECKAGDNCVYVTISGTYYFNGSSRSNGKVTYIVYENYDVSIDGSNTTNGIENTILSWASYLANT